MRQIIAPSLLVILLSALSGCVGSHTVEENREFVVPKEADDSAKQKGVDDPHTVEVKVTEEWADGRPIKGAAVVFFTTFTHTEGDTYNTHTEIRHTPLATARTGADGLATMQVAPETTVRVLVGDAAGFTKELYDAYLTGAPDGFSTLSVPLYKTTLDLRFAATFPLAASANKATFGNHERVWHNRPLDFHNDTVASAGYLERLLTAHITLRWENDATHGGDLGVGVAIDQQPPVIFSDEDTQYQLGEQTEELQLEPDDVVSLLEKHPAPAYALTAFTDSAALSSQGLPYEFAVMATFFSSDFEIKS